MEPAKRIAPSSYRLSSSCEKRFFRSSGEMLFRLKFGEFILEKRPAGLMMFLRYRRALFGEFSQKLDELGELDEEVRLVSSQGWVDTCSLPSISLRGKSFRSTPHPKNLNISTFRHKTNFSCINT